MFGRYFFIITIITMIIFMICVAIMLHKEDMEVSEIIIYANNEDSTYKNIKITDVGNLIDIKTTMGGFFTRSVSIVTTTKGKFLTEVIANFQYNNKATLLQYNSNRIYINIGDGKRYRLY